MLVSFAHFLELQLEINTMLAYAIHIFQEIPESYFLLAAICSGSLCQSFRNYETRQRTQCGLEKKTHQ